MTARRPPRLARYTCMAIATEKDICGKPASIEHTVIVVINKSFVPVHLCAKHGKPVSLSGGIQETRTSKGKR
jgi:hypothetical protein